MKRSARTLFVTGTDTGVGKTTVSCALAAAFRHAGLVVGSLKPIETGCAPGPEGLHPADAIRLGEAAGAQASLEQLCPNRYRLPVSPEAAATAEARPVDLPAIHTAHSAWAGACDLLLIEGAGGLLVPIAPGYTIAELARDLGAPLLIVARATLGTVNHTLLTVEAARHRHLPIAGVVLNRVREDRGPDDATNADAIARHGQVRVLGTFPWASDASFHELAELATQHLDLQALLQAL